MIYQIRFILGIFLGKLASVGSRLFSGGSGEQIQGRIIDLICPKALQIQAKKFRIVVISATNGKTTTTRLIATALKNANTDVVSNALGANQRAGIVSALVNSKHSGSKKIAILEVDERSLPGMFNELDPELIVFGNLSRDQLDRFGEVSSISRSWRAMLENSHANVIANGCDPHIVFAVDHLAKDKVRYADIQSNWHDDSHSCPKCGELLDWDSKSHFESKTCGFATPKEIEAMDTKLRDKLALSIKLPGDWNISNAYLAYLACKYFELSDDDIFPAFSTVQNVAGRNAIYQLDDERTVQLFLAKNPAGWNETLNYISTTPSDATVFAFNCNIADGKDPSWLYDVNFEGVSIDEFIVFGKRATDMAVRLEVAGKTVNEVKDIYEALAHSAFAGHTNIVASYTQFLALSRLLPKITVKASTK